MMKFLNPDGDWQGLETKATKEAIGPNMIAFINKLSNVLDKDIIDAMNYAAREIQIGKGRFPGDEKSTIHLGVPDILAIVLGTVFANVLVTMIDAGCPVDAVMRAQKTFRSYATPQARLAIVKGRIMVARKRMN